MKNDRLTPIFYYFFYHFKWHHHVAFYISFLINLYTFTLAHMRLKEYFARGHILVSFSPTNPPTISPQFFKPHSFISLSLVCSFSSTKTPPTRGRSNFIWRWLSFNGETRSAIFISYFHANIFFLPSFPPMKFTTKETSHT